MKKKKRVLFAKILLRILLTLLLLVLLAAAIVFLLPLAESVSRAEVPGSADWMADLDDDLVLSEINLPGTHNSGTQYASLPFFSKCQSLSVREQLDAGFRYLDIRLGGDGDTGLILKHGFTDCKITPFGRTPLSLSDVLEDCYAFLLAHPTETVLFCVKHEHGDLSVDDMQTMLREETDADRPLWLLTDTMPTLGECRGKVVLLRRWEDDADFGPEAGIPFGWADQGGHETTDEDTEANVPGDYLLWIQDRYEYGIRDKWNAFLRGLAIGASEEEAALHFLSTKGEAAYGHPFHFALHLNRRLLKTDLPQGPFGWIIVDFGSARLAEHVWQTNFD